MKHNWRLGILIAASLAGVASPAAAQREGPHFRVQDGCIQDLIQAVGLTSAQQTALDALRQQTADATQPILDQLQALHQQIDTALELGSPAACAIGNLEVQGYSLRTQMLAILKNAEATFVESLSAEQQTKYAAFIASNPQCAAFPSRLPGLGMLHPHA